MIGIPDFSKRYNVESELSEQDKQHANFGGIKITPKASKFYRVANDKFENEYQTFIAKLKTQKENAVEEVTNVAETKVEEPQVTEEAPVVETKPKKTRTKKQVVNVLPEETVETTTETTNPVVEPDPFAEF